MTADEIRETFLAFFEERDHRLPPVRTVLKGLNQDITPALSWFYQAPFLAILVLQVLNFILFIGLLHEPMKRRFGDAVGDWELTLLVVLVIAAVLIQAMILAAAGRWPSLGPLGRSISSLEFRGGGQPAAQTATIQEQIDTIERRLQVLETGQTGKS